MIRRLKGALRGLVERLKASDMFKNVMRISSGTLLGQLILIATTPVMTRLYGAAIIGDWTFLQAISVVVAAFSDLGLSNALMVEKTEEDLVETYKVVTTCVVAASLLVSVGVALFYGFAAPGGIVLPPLVLAGYLFLTTALFQQTQVCYTWLNRKSRYDVLMKSPVLNYALFGVLAVGFGLLGFTQYGYFLSWLLSLVATVALMRHHLPKGFFTVRPAAYRAVISRNRHFLQYQLPSNIVLQLKNLLPSLLIKPLFGSDILGQYAITMRIINLPVSLVGTSIGRVFFQTATDMQREGKKIGGFAYGIMTRSMKLACLPVVGLVVFGDVVLNWFLGPGWQMAGNIVRIVALQSFFMFLNMSTQGLNITLNRQKYTLLSSVFQMVSMVVIFFMGAYWFHSIYISVGLMTVVYSFIQIFFMCLLLRDIEMPYWKYVRTVVLYTLLMAAGYLVLRLPMYLAGWVPSM